MDSDEITPDSGAAAPAGEVDPSQAPDVDIPGDGATPGDGVPGETPPEGEETDWSVAGPRLYKLNEMWNKGEHPTLKASRRKSEERKVQLEELNAKHLQLQSAHARVTQYTDKLYAQRLEGLTPEEKTALENEARLALLGPSPTAPAPTQPTSKEDTLEPTLRQILEAGGFQWGDSRFDVGEPGEDATARIASLTSQITDIKKVSEEIPGSPPPPRHPTDTNGGATTPRGTRLTLAKLMNMTAQEIAKLDQKDVDRALEAAK